MHDRLPVACTLDAHDFAAREALIADLGRDALLDMTLEGPHAVLRFAGGDGVRDRVESFVRGERACCAFLTMQMRRTGNEIELRIDAPDDAELVLAELVAAFGPGRRAA